jgi:murein endopeptidase
MRLSLGVAAVLAGRPLLGKCALLAQARYSAPVTLLRAPFTVTLRGAPIIVGAIGIIAAATATTACAGADGGAEARPSLRASLAASAARVVQAQPGPPTEVEAALIEPRAMVRHPLEGMKIAALVQLVRERPQELGSASIGRPNKGRLFNGHQLQDSPLIKIESPYHSWGTSECIASLERAVARVGRRFPDSPRLHVGDISRKRGGHLRPHRSHQSGLDADIGYYYLEGEAWYQHANADTLDRERSWELVRALVDQENVEYLFIDRSVQKLLREHAEQRGDDPGLLEGLFQGPASPEGVIRHARGHANHMHVRFRDERARETARRVYPLLRRYGKL